MVKSDDKQKKQDLGIFYTLPEVTNFIFDILNLWKEKEDTETQRWQSRKHFPSVIDPAVGEGVFLKAAIMQGFTKPKYVFGIDINEEVKERWVKINLLKSFGSRAELNVHFFHQNGLLPLDEKKRLRYKKGGLKEFDAVVGNPPYGGLGLSETALTDEIIRQLANFALLPEGIKNNLISASAQAQLLPFLEKPSKITGAVKQKVKAVAIEILFVERFIQLAKPGGWIAIIIPDGILTNSNAYYVREFIAEKTKLEAIVSLPRGAFKQAGTSAKTSILFLRKYPPPVIPSEARNLNYPVFLASVTEAIKENLKKVANEYKKFYNNQSDTMHKQNKSNQIAIIKDESGREAVMVRVDKTVKELMEEKPSSRWNVDYWRQIYLDNQKFLEQSNFEIGTIGQFEERLTYGAIVTGKKDYSGNDVFLVNQGNISFTGLDLIDVKQVKRKSPWVIERAFLKDKTILIARSGVAGVGKNRMTIAVNPPKSVADSFVDILDLKNINPFYVVVFWKSVFGWLQIERLINGVGTVNISFNEIRTIKIPILPEKIQNHIETVYKKMSAFHDKAMEAKKQGDEQGYQKNKETAESMLRDLIAKTEAVIRGEREDVG